MARKRKGRVVNGVLILQKPQGITSNRALQEARHCFFAQKAGHTGSLDPLATGILPVCFGEATKFSQFLLDADKTYKATITFGETTDSGDADGRTLVKQDASDVTANRVSGILEGFIGEITQTPPMYSALKHNGEPLYKIARRGEKVAVKQRQVIIYKARLLDFREGSQPQADIEVHCSKGTYIRTLAEDIGNALGCGGHISALHRSQVSVFHESDGVVTLPELKVLQETADFDTMEKLLKPVDVSVQHFPEVVLTEESCFYLLQGQAVWVPKAPTEGTVRITSNTDNFLGIGKVLDDGRIAPTRLVATA